MVKILKKTVLSLMVISLSSASAFSAGVVLKSSTFGGGENAPQDAKGVIADCETRIKMVDGKEGLFKLPPHPSSSSPKPTSFFKKLQQKKEEKWKKDMDVAEEKWKKDVAAVEAKKKEYIEDMANLHAFFEAEKAKIAAGNPADPKFASTFQEMYSNCKRFADGIASKVSKAAGITPYKKPGAPVKK